jgi:hypothetical protein
MTRRWPLLLVALCMAWCQQGALLHGLRHHHLPRAAAQAALQASAHQEGVACDTCFAFEHVACALATASTVASLLPADEHWRLHERFAHLAASAPDASARDPPRS